MSTATPGPSDPMNRRRWFMPAFCLFLGALIFGAFWIGDDPGRAPRPRGVLVAVAPFGGRRSRRIAGISWPGRDERWERIDLAATAISGVVIITAIIVAWLVEVARGNDGSPYTELGALGGLAYVLAVALLRWRS